jgi:hypothetical protein
MKRKIIVIACGVLLSAVLLFGAIPVAAADGPSTTSPPATQTAGKGTLFVRILSIPTQSQLEALLTKAEANGKITSAQATKIENFWTANHAKFVKVVKAKILQRLLSVKNEASLKAFLDKAVSAGKITATQESTIIRLWESAHSS